MAQIILASASPRRSELLRQAGMDFIVILTKKKRAASAGGNGFYRDSI